MNSEVAGCHLIPYFWIIKNFRCKDKNKYDFTSVHPIHAYNVVLHDMSRKWETGCQLLVDEIMTRSYPLGNQFSKVSG